MRLDQFNCLKITVDSFKVVIWGRIFTKIQFFKPPSVQWRTQYWHAVLDERGFGKDLIDRLSDSAMDLEIKTGELSVSEIDMVSRNLMNLDPEFTLHETEFRLERAWKTSTRDYFNGSLEWIFLTNPPTAFKIENFLQWLTINDIGRLCSNFPLAKMMCSEDCKICVARVSTIGTLIKFNYFQLKNLITVFMNFQGIFESFILLINNRWSRSSCFIDFIGFGWLITPYFNG